MYCAYATLPRDDSDERWWTWQHATKSRSVHLRPDNLGTTRGMLTFMSDVRGLEELGRDDLLTLLRRTFADVGGAAPRILDALDAGAPMYFSAVGQVHPPVWSKGRIGLLGDSAFCNATFGGAGTSLALIGGYLLARELDGGEDPSVALRRYQDVMQPFVATAPTVREDTLRLANPRTRFESVPCTPSAASPRARSAGHSELCRGWQASVVTSSHWTESPNSASMAAISAAVAHDGFDCIGTRNTSSDARSGTVRSCAAVSGMDSSGMSTGTRCLPPSTTTSPVIRPRPQIPRSGRVVTHSATRWPGCINRVR